MRGAAGIFGNLLRDVGELFTALDQRPRRVDLGTLLRFHLVGCVLRDANEDVTGADGFRHLEFVAVLLVEIFDLVGLDLGLAVDELIQV